MTEILPVGKLPPEFLKTIIKQAPVFDKRVKLGPGIGLDCGIVDNGDSYLVMKTDPITFATEDIGWYAVQITANDIATTGAKPQWMMVTALFPQDLTTEATVQKVTDQLFSACCAMNISLVNAHTEITYDIRRPLLMCSLVGEVAKDRLVTPQGAQPGDHVLLTKGIPIEGTAILAKEFSAELKDILTAEELAEAQAYTHDPGIGVTRDAHLATRCGRVTGMHDPTEGGLASALWELSEACGHRIDFDSEAVLIPDLSRKICAAFQLNPLNTIASGALLMTVAAADCPKIMAGLAAEGIRCAKIGMVSAERGNKVWDNAKKELLPWPKQDEITKVFS